MYKLAKVENVKTLSGYKVRLSFSDGKVKVIDLEKYLKGPIFESVKKPSTFKKVRVSLGTIRWPNGADICPDVLYYDGIPPWAKKYLKK